MPLTHPTGAWVHEAHPFLWRIHGEIGIRWYGLAYLAGLVLGGWLLSHWRRQQRLPLHRGELQDFVFTVGLAMVLGGRLGFCAFYQPSLFIEVGGSFPWWGVLRVMDGGMASHGGIIGLLVGSWWWCHRHGRSFAVLIDAVAVGAPIGIMCGRLANFANGELWGRVCDPSLPWACVFTTEMTPPASTLVEVAMLAPRHPSQLYAVVLEGLIPFLVALPLHAKHRRPGLSAAIVLSLYAVGRCIDEYFREPDIGQPGSPGHAFILGLFTKGQALTLPILVIAIVVGVLAWRRGQRPAAYAAPAQPETKPSA
jgi:phosphatidylglycerol---prolipoprotein diacylglyceryl transferase